MEYAKFNQLNMYMIMLRKLWLNADHKMLLTFGIGMDCDKVSLTNLYPLRPKKDVVDLSKFGCIYTLNRV